MNTKPTYDSYGDIRLLIEDLFRVRPMIYWVDLLACAGVGWGLFAWLAQTQAPFWGWKGVGLLVCSFVLFRGLIFIHELAHRRPNELPGFHRAWNVLFGILFFLPEYTYLPHSIHHRTATYSTGEDPEYLPLASQSWWQILAPFLLFPFIPFVLAFRFLILGPLSLILGGTVREWVLRHVSTLKMNPRYEWKNISSEDRRKATLQDLLCLSAWAVIGGYVALTGRWGILLNWYLISSLVLMINHLRSFARHLYINAKGTSLSFEDQLLDSVTIHGFSPLASLFMPIGLRWHSIHHMFPTIPYHAMPAAHHRLIQALPAGHLYFKTLVNDFVTAQWKLFRSKPLQTL